MAEDRKKSLMSMIQAEYKSFSKGQKLIADYILNHCEKAAYMTAARLGEEVGVSESTVVRFANALSYQGYPELQRGLQEITKTRLTTVQRIEMEDYYSNEAFDVKKVLKNDIDNIRVILEEVDNEDFNGVINEILKARKVYIIGLRSSTALAEYLGFYLRVMLEDVQVISLGISDVFEQLVRIRKEDVVIGITYPRYSKRTIDSVRYAKTQGARIIGITDSKHSPINDLADHMLYAKSNMLSFVDSLVAPMSLINALIVGVGLRQKNEIKEYFDELESMWKEYKVYDPIYDD